MVNLASSFPAIARPAVLILIFMIFSLVRVRSPHASRYLKEVTMAPLPNA